MKKKTFDYSLLEVMKIGRDNIFEGHGVADCEASLKIQAFTVAPQPLAIIDYP